MYKRDFFLKPNALIAGEQASTDRDRKHGDEDGLGKVQEWQETGFQTNWSTCGLMGETGHFGKSDLIILIISCIKSIDIIFHKKVSLLLLKDLKENLHFSYSYMQKVPENL